MTEREELAPLELLDPELESPGYWRRFQSQLILSAEGRLALRRRQSAPSMPEVLNSWGRLLVPGSLLAAAIAALLLMGGPKEMDQVNNMTPLLGVEEILGRTMVEGESLPAFLLSDAVPDRNAVLFAVEGG